MVRITTGGFDAGFELRSSELGENVSNTVGSDSVGVGVFVLDMVRKADGDPVAMFLLGKNV